MVIARTQAGLSYFRVVDPRVPSSLAPSNLHVQGHLFDDAKNLHALRNDPRFARAFSRMHEDDEGVVQRPHLNKDNTFFMGDIMPGSIVDALHYIDAERAHPLLKRGISVYEDDAAVVRGAFNELAKETGLLNSDFADHVRVVTLPPDDYAAYAEETLSRGPADELMRSAGLSVPVAGLVVLPDSDRTKFIHALTHELVHQMEVAVYFVRSIDGLPTLPVYARRSLRAALPDFHLLKSGVETALVDKFGDEYIAFRGFNEGLTQLFANEMLLKLAPKVNVDAEDLIFLHGGDGSYPLHTLIVEELLTQIAGDGSKHEVFDRALRSYVRGTAEIYHDLQDHLGEHSTARIAKIGTDNSFLRLAVLTIPELEHLRPQTRSMRNFLIANNMAGLNLFTPD